MMNSASTRHKRPQQSPSIDIQSVLRIRPLKKSEKEDHVVLEPSKYEKVALLHPVIHMTSPEARRRSFEQDMFIKEGEEQQFHFDSILDCNATQDKLHYSMGLGMALDAMEPLKQVGTASSARNHLVVAMGVCNTGKTYTTFGSQKALGRTSGKHVEDGLVPRIFESFFSQSKHHIRDKSLSFAARITMVHVENDKAYDMLTVVPENTNSQAPGSASKNRAGVLAMVANLERVGVHTESTTKSGRNGMEEILIEQDETTHDFVFESTSNICRSVVEARETLHSGLKRASAGLIGGLVGKNAKGHTLVTIQPVLVQRNGTIKHRGGTVSVLDMAGIERVKKNRSGTMRDGIAVNSAVSAVMHCLRTIKHNSDVLSGTSSLGIACQDDESLDGSDISNVSEIKEKKLHQNLKKVPYLQSKVTMLLQPVLAASEDQASVTLILAAYPGHRDYGEKKSLLSDFEMLRGAELAMNGTSKTSTPGNTKHRSKRNSSSTKKLVKANTGTEPTLDLSDVEDSEDEAPPSNRKKRKQDRATPYKVATATKLPSTLHSVRGSRAVRTTNPTAPTASVLGVHDLTPMPPPCAPHYESSEPSIKPLQPQSMYASDIPMTYSSSSGSQGASSPNTGVESPSPTKTSKVEAVSFSQIPEAHKFAIPVATAVPVAPASTSRQGMPTSHASVSKSPNIRAPPTTTTSPMVENNTTNVSLPEKKRIKDKSPIKAINKAVHASKKKGQRAMQKMEDMVSQPFVDAKPHTVKSETKRNRPQNDNRQGKLDDKESKKVLLNHIKKLEKQNAKLSEQNVMLETKCETLTMEKEKLSALLREARRHKRQTDWTALDEEEFHNSRRLRLQHQQLIRSPLRQHLENVDATDKIHSTWLKSGKEHFSLQFPSHFVRAPDLDRRDRALEVKDTKDPANATKALSVSTNEGSEPARRAHPNTSLEKRKVFEDFQSVVKENKKIRFDLQD